MHDFVNLIPLIWSPENGFNWNVVLLYAVTLVFTSPVLLRVVSFLINWIGVQVDKIHFTIFGWAVDFNLYQWDNDFFLYIRESAEHFIEAKQTEVDWIKDEYKSKLQKDLTEEEKTQLVANYKADLEAVTESLIRDMLNHGDEKLMRALRSRFGDKAADWLRTRVKALIEKRNKYLSPFSGGQGN